MGGVKDDQKNFTISLYDIDETILLQLEQLQLQVTDAGKKIKVPVTFGSPQVWASAQRDGYIRDNQGKVILPAIILKRTTSDSDDTLKFFNRYLHGAVIKTYTQKNQYTKFALLAGQNVPVNEVYNVVVPSHMVLTYHFIIWTEYVEQMNELVETLRFNTNDYWGSKKGFRFRTKVESFGHTVELQANEDRVVKTEFDLTVHGYILPDSITKLDKHSSTTNKMFTPKKIVMGAEVVSTDYDMTKFNSNTEKWRNQNYPNLPSDVVIPSPPISVVDNINDDSLAGQIVNSLRTSTINPSPLPIPDSIPVATSYLHVVPPPPSIDASGQEGNVSYDDTYFYIYSNGWKRVAISQFT